MLNRDCRFLLLAILLLCIIPAMGRPVEPVRDGLDLWLDAARIGGGDTSIVRWADASGNRRDLVQENPAARPIARE